ncbi:MAG: M56 family metallopeptidase [Acidobacteria bacterium]|jgi:Zn-dependent protease with chaperone function|nr:M56 family metallopeptidase [Acidobacteriota bacterium]
MYFLLITSLILALLLVLNAVISISASVLWRVAAKQTRGWTAQNRARFIFALRVFPFASALVFALGFLLPAYILFEPHSSSETVGFKLAFLSIVSASGVGFAFYKVFRTQRATRNLVADWMEHAEPIRVEGVSIPVYKIKHSFPVIAVVGAFRPRMFVAAQIFESLDDAEFRATARHEAGHLAARDNLKRTVMRACRDLLIFPFGQKLDRAWAENIEAGADEYAAETGGKQAALNLASALIKIARIIPDGTKPSMPAGAFLIEAPTAEIAFRVRKLLEMSDGKTIFQTALSSNFLFAFYSVSALFVLTLLATNQNFLQEVHDILETIVAFLQ